MLTAFVDFASDKLGIKSLPNVRYKDDDDEYNSFAAYNPSKNEVSVQTKGRHPMDVMRSVAHELVHHWQKENGKIGKDIAKEGSTGSPQENEANAVAGKIMRWFAKANPDSFSLAHIVEAVFVVGGPCSGKDRVAREIKEDLDYDEIDVSAFLKTQNAANRTIINASAQDFDSIKAAKEILEANGYYTSIVFVDVSNDISKIRNESRASKGQRTLSESLRFTKYDAAVKNKDRFKGLFGEERMSIIDNNSLTEEVKKPTGKLKDACWKGYTAVGTKKKNGKTVPNCVPMDERFESEVADREEGTTSLRKTYEKNTPGQKKKIAKKKKKIIAKEDNMPPLWYGLNPDGSNYMGPEAFTSVSPYPMLGTGGSYLGLAESIVVWALKPETQSNFVKKYGDLAEQKLVETMVALNESLEDRDISTVPKTFQQLREYVDKVNIMGTVPSVSQYKDGDFVEEGSAKVDKASMKCNKPRAQATGDSLTGKSHVVKACAGGKEKIIRFGQRGVKGSPKKEGESKAYANRRKRFKARHSKNIKKGKMSAAWWANKVKW